MTHPAEAYPKDVAAAAIVLGGMGAAWMLWGSSFASDTWALILRVGALAGIALAVWGVRARARAAGPSMHDPGSGGNRFWLVMVVIEVVAIVAGLLLLVNLGHPLLAICWTHVVMGAHWLPMVKFYRIPQLAISAVVAIVLGLAGFAWYALTDGGWPGLIVGGLGGLAMMAMSAYLLASLRDGAPSGRR